MVIEYILFVFGIYLLIKGANLIVESSTKLAKKFGISSLIIGLTIVAFGTSLPELIINMFAAYEGASQIAFGNIIGSNIANILLVLGIVGLISGVSVKNSVVWNQIPFALLAAFVLFILSSNVIGGSGNVFLGPRDSLILLSLFGLYLYEIFKTSKGDLIKTKKISKKKMPNAPIFLKFGIGIIAIYLGGRFVIDGAVFVASQFGLSEFVISATIIAIGTSLPELVVSVVAALKKNIDLAVGNIIGSNIFNIFWVLGIVPLISPLLVPNFVLIDIAIMFFVTLTLFVFMFIGKTNKISRSKGIIFLLLYISYIVYIIFRG